MSFVEGEFIANEPARVKLRDQKRNEFFAQYTQKRLNNPFGVKTLSGDQHQKMLKLFETAMSLNDGHITGLAALIAEFTTLDFGLSELPSRIFDIVNVMPENLAKQHFNMDWAGWFDE